MTVQCWASKLPTIIANVKNKTDELSFDSDTINFPVGKNLDKTVCFLSFRFF